MAKAVSRTVACWKRSVTFLPLPPTWGIAITATLWAESSDYQSCHAGTVLAKPAGVSGPPKLLDRVREAIRTRHYSRRTEEAYAHWIRRYIVFHGKTHPSEMGDIDMHAVLGALHETGFAGPIRSDHGRMIWGETGQPGYGLHDRALGAMYLHGLWEGVTGE